MPLILEISEEDVKRSKIIEPGTYLFDVKDVFTKSTKDGSGKNVVVDFIGAESAVEGIPVRRYFPLSALGFLIPFVRACGGEVGEKGAKIDLEACKGKRIKVSIKTGLYQERQTNVADDFFPVD